MQGFFSAGIFVGSDFILAVIFFAGIFFAGIFLAVIFSAGIFVAGIFVAGISSVSPLLTLAYSYQIRRSFPKKNQEIYHISKAQTNTFSSGLPNFYFFIFVAFNFAQSFFKFFYPRRQHMFDVCIATSNSQVLSTYKVIF